jgi:hypothetical protein
MFRVDSGKTCYAPSEFAGRRFRVAFGSWLDMKTVYLILASFLAISGQWSSVAAATRVDLIIDESLPDRSVVWPVTTGVPFSRGQLTDEKHCRLIDEFGREHLLQTKVAATWDAERKSVRWLTIDFLAEPGRKYALEFGPEIERRKVTSPLTVEDDVASGWKIDTGVLQSRFDQAKGAFSKVSLRDSNGSWDQVIRETEPRGHYYVNKSGGTFRETQKSIVTVENSGPVRACVRVDEVLRGPPEKGNREKPIVHIRTRYHFFAGLKLVKAVTEFRIVGSTKGTTFRDIGFSLPQLSGDVTSVAIGTRVQSKVIEVPWQVSTKSVSSFQKTYRHFGNPQCEGGVVEVTDEGERTVHEARRIGEWIQVRNEKFAVTGSLRWMWQQFPKEWEVSRDGLTLHLWSPRAGELDFGADGLRSFFGEAGSKYLLEWNPGGRLNAISNFFYYAGHAALKRGEVDGQGLNKHHEFWLHFGEADEAKIGQEYGALAARQPLALATGEWNCSTDVFGPLMPRKPKESQDQVPLNEVNARKSGGPDLAKYEAIVDRLFDLGQKAQDDFGDYGWHAFGSGPHYSYQWDEKTQRHFADPRRFEYHTYQKETQLWWNYFRSGERKFYNWAIPSEDHWVDIAVTHVPLEYECDWRGGFLKKQTLHFRPGDWSIDSPLFYVRQRDSAEAWLRGCSQFQASYHRTLETTSLAYYLTGDERYNDVLKFWQDYWKDFAGLRSDQPDKFPPWLREQPWFEPTKPGEPSKSWAEMIRDYCPFTSGLRHQMTYFFSLATLYEHTWDPKIGEVLKECADAYLDPDHRIGVWRTQENGPPAYAAAPELAHFWVPALWKYARATGDPQMPGIFKKYFAACYAADPFREDVGRYSDVHLGYAYYFTKDPRHLRPAQLALDKLLPNAQPLAKPQDLGQRLYNPYAPIQSFTAVPRLLWALDRAHKDGVEIPRVPLLRPQRTAIGVPKAQDSALNLTLWGYDKTVRLIGPNGKRFTDFEVRTEKHASNMQPFDRTTVDFEVFLHEVVIPAAAPAGFYVLSPRLEIAVLHAGSNQHEKKKKRQLKQGQTPAQIILVNASRPVAIEPGRDASTGIGAIIRVPDGIESVKFESADARSLAVLTPDGKLFEQGQGNELIVKTKSLPNPRLLFIQIYDPKGTRRQPLWFRMDLPPEHCWCAASIPPHVKTLQELAESLKNYSHPDALVTAAALRPDPEPVSMETWSDGRFGKSLQIVPGRKLTLPDHVTVDGKEVRLFNMTQGTIEFFAKRQWDDRLVTPKPVTFLTNGWLKAWCPRPLPVGEWAHVAVEWRPLKRDPERIAVHIYVDGLDQQNYRSTWWEGYSQKPVALPLGERLRKFVCETVEDAPFAIDELRISTIARYADQNVEFGGHQVFNPSRFTPPRQAFTLDAKTAVLLHFDGSTNGESGLVNARIEGRLSD